MMLYWMQEELCFCRQGSTTIVLCETIIFHELESNLPICPGSPNGRRENGRECFGHNEDCQGGEGSHYSGQDLEWSFRDFQRISFFGNIYFHHLVVRFILPEDLFISFFANIFHHLVVRWKKLSKKNPLKWTRASS